VHLCTETFGARLRPVCLNLLVLFTRVTNFVNPLNELIR